MLFREAAIVPAGLRRLFNHRQKVAVFGKIKIHPFPRDLC